MTYRYIVPETLCAWGVRLPRVSMARCCHSLPNEQTKKNKIVESANIFWKYTCTWNHNFTEIDSSSCAPNRNNPPYLSWIDGNFWLDARFHPLQSMVTCHQTVPNQRNCSINWANSLLGLLRYQCTSTGKRQILLHCLWIPENNDVRTLSTYSYLKIFVLWREIVF